MRKRTGGFTLIEVMITVAIIAIVAAIAYPSYQSHVQRTRRGDAISSLLELAQAQERFMTRCGHYATRIDGTASCNDSAEGLGKSTLSNEGFYQLSFAAAGAASYTLKAVPRGVQASDTECAALTLNQLGERRAESKKDADGNAANTSKACW
ncbi:type IV pilin protein [Pistricoccus aurantiacus]|uniref:type IV pilin protein n=1 Tax=Pistricoccus aurantiacus TaxID=1883414 RepID=UPI0036310880